MAQHNWAYTGGSGKQYVVGLYHGTESGHLMVYCDLRVILIEFSILQDYTYSFFIEDDMLDLTIKRSKDQFQYGFHVNREVDTPKNQARKVQEKQERRWMSVSLVVLAIVALMLFGAWWYNEVYKSEEDLKQVQYSAWHVPAKVFVSNTSGVKYSFVANGKGYESQTARPQQTLFPLESGDEFMVHYDMYKPRIHVLDFQSPTNNQIARYRKRAAERHLILHPDLSKKQIECLLDIALQIKGLDAYADFYFQNTPVSENPLHNQETYGRLTRDVPFQKAAKECK